VIAERFVVISAPLEDNQSDWKLVGPPETQIECERVAEIHATNDPLRRFYVAELKTCSKAVARTLEVG
jgi:hypothetical protein